MAEVLMKGGDFLAHKRRAKGFSQRDFAKALKVSESAVGQWETGRNRIRRSLILRIADLLSLSPEEAAQLPATHGRSRTKMPDAVTLLESRAIVTAEDLQFLVELEGGTRPLEAHVVVQVLFHRLRHREKMDHES